MKKGILVCLLCCILMIFSSCSTLIDMLMEKDSSGFTAEKKAGSPPPAETADPVEEEDTATDDPVEEEKNAAELSEEKPDSAKAAQETILSPEELLDTLSFHLDLLNQCYAETGGAQLGDVQYARIYTSAEAAMAGEAPIDIVEWDPSQDSNLTDPTGAVLYEILNFRSNAEALAYLEQYMVPEVAERMFHEFFESNGKLYMVYGGRGYGAEQLDLDSASISVSGDTCTVTLDFCLFDEKVSTATVSFEKQGEDWIITSIDGTTV